MNVHLHKSAMAKRPLSGAEYFAKYVDIPFPPANAPRVVVKVKRKKAATPRFTAVLPLEIREETVKTRITKAEWDTLPPDGRDYWTSWRDVRNPRTGMYRSVATTVYRSVTPVKPYPNPAIATLRKKLGNMATHERIIWKDGRAFLEIKTALTLEDL